SVPSVLGGQTDPGSGPPDSPPGRPSRPLPACRPERVPLLGTGPAPKGQRGRQALFLLPLGRRRGPRGASRTGHAPYTALSTRFEKVPKSPWEWSRLPIGPDFFAEAWLYHVRRRSKTLGLLSHPPP